MVNTYKAGTTDLSICCFFTSQLICGIHNRQRNEARVSYTLLGRRFLIDKMSTIKGTQNEVNLFRLVKILGYFGFKSTAVGQGSHVKLR